MASDRVLRGNVIDILLSMHRRKGYEYLSVLQISSLIHLQGVNYARIERVVEKLHANMPELLSKVVRRGIAHYRLKQRPMHGLSLQETVAASEPAPRVAPRRDITPPFEATPPATPTVSPTLSEVSSVSSDFSSVESHEMSMVRRLLCKYLGRYDATLNRYSEIHVFTGAYKLFMLDHHPDRNGTADLAHVQRINGLYTMLREPL